MNVQELINELEKIENKTKEVKLGNRADMAGIGAMLTHFTVTEVDASNTYLTSVYLDVIDETP